MNGFFYWVCGAIFGASVFSIIQTKAKLQATKSSQAEVELHIERQRNLGERMIGDNDKPRACELLATAAIVGLILFGTFRGWW